VRAGADLVCYANKYFDAPHSTGLVLGKKDYVDLVALNSFIGFETSDFQTMGRAMKVDRQEVFATVVACASGWPWTTRRGLPTERAERVLRGLKGARMVEAYRISERETPRPVIRDGVRLVLRDAAAAQSLVTALRNGDPSVWVRVDDDRADCVNVSVAFCSETELDVVIRRLREVLGA
jgi:hypothetical protein